MLVCRVLIKSVRVSFSAANTRLSLSLVTGEYFRASLGNGVVLLIGHVPISYILISKSKTKTAIYN